MRFAFILPNLVGGGAEKALLKLAQQLLQNGHEAHLVLLEHSIEHKIPAKVTITPLEKNLQRGWLKKRIAARKLRRHILNNGPWDLIVSTLPFADEVATLAHQLQEASAVRSSDEGEIRALRENALAKVRVLVHTRRSLSLPLSHTHTFTLTHRCC